MLMQRQDAALLVVDIQDKLLPAVHDADGLLKRSRWLVAAARDHQLPIVFSEQYPRGLGGTAAALREAAPEAPTVDKLHFSCVAADCLPPLLTDKRQIIVCGMEAHVCVLQTALELLQAGKQVFVVADAVSSRKASDVELALARMRAAGAQIVSREMVLFELLRQSGSDHFKQMSQRYLMGEQP
ncbi:hydrolase [Chromobacterium subtsugae]|uniref:Hydrolase n=1 Tax=Chromobacterium subtsugae TaxID=251747 RepID=A0ABS7FDL7_9NEIS|nr:MULTISPECIES: hydrolase [Chromobacterium]KUM04033.1 isochorismatase [Chromobacterium subtsugae]KZE86877.1 hydrolase [Chromobacterium sp. F49]MBW7566866.1 hydrolase [Chromobacterium subtsugae]MBW8288171.1 hydrolase [Chromobacterium subtsugae]OBU86583.1 isochorismatase [Chromobacterium subtsugae]